MKMESNQPRSVRAVPAFTLIEMLIVIGLIGVLAALTMPTIRSLSRGDVITIGLRQLTDDLNYARLRAINGRSPVYVVFFPNQSYSPTPLTAMQANITNFISTNHAANHLLSCQLSSYAIFAGRTLGDQPGQPTPHYF